MTGILSHPNGKYHEKNDGFVRNRFKRKHKIKKGRESDARPRETF